MFLCAFENESYSVDDQLFDRVVARVWQARVQMDALSMTGTRTAVNVSAAFRGHSRTKLVGRVELIRPVYFDSVFDVPFGGMGLRTGTAAPVISFALNSTHSGALVCPDLCPAVEALCTHDIAVFKVLTAVFAEVFPALVTGGGEWSNAVRVQSMLGHEGFVNAVLPRFMSTREWAGALRSYAPLTALLPDCYEEEGA
jgi:hypothetical protein